MKHTLLDSVDQMTKSLNHKLPLNYTNILNIWTYSCTIWNIVIYLAFQTIWIQTDYEEAIISFDYWKNLLNNLSYVHYDWQKEVFLYKWGMEKVVSSSQWNKSGVKKFICELQYIIITMRMSAAKPWKIRLKPTIELPSTTPVNFPPPHS
jgi:hypothetical protein